MKDDYKVKVYLSKDVLEYIAVSEQEFPNLNKIFRESAVFILDMSDDELDESLENTESDFAVFCNAYNIKTIANKSILTFLMANKDEMVKRCRSIFFLDINEADAERMQKEYGLLVISINQIDDNIFNKHFWRHRFNVGDSFSGDAVSEWKEILRDVPWLPTNSLIITDDYLFTKSGVSLDECIENVKGLLDAIIPNFLDVDYHVLIVTTHPDCEDVKINQAVGNIKSYINGRRGFDVNVECVFYHALHQRKVITNYNVMVCDKGFVNFSNRKHKVTDTNPTYACSVFQNIVDSIGDTEYGIATADMEDLHKIASEVKAMINGGVKDTKKRILGDCQKDKSINNRLLCARV